MLGVWRIADRRPEDYLLLPRLSPEGLPSQKKTGYQTPTVYIMSSRECGWPGRDGAGLPELEGARSDSSPGSRWPMNLACHPSN